MPVYCPLGGFWEGALAALVPSDLHVFLDLPPGSALRISGDFGLILAFFPGAPYLEDLYDRWPGRVLAPPHDPHLLRASLELAAAGGRLPRPVPRSGLAPRERQVLRLLVSGLAPRAIAQELGISAGTVHAYLGVLREKLAAPTTSALVSAYYGLPRHQDF